MRLLVLLIISIQGFAFHNPDIYVLSRTNRQWNKVLIDRLELFMKNIEANIDYKKYSNDEILFSDKEFSSYAPEKVKSIFEELELVTEIDFLSPKPKLKVVDFNYEMDSVEPEVYPFEVMGEDLDIKANIKVSGIELKASEIRLSLNAKDSAGEEFVAFEAIVNKPQIRIRNKESVNFDIDFHLKKSSDKETTHYIDFVEGDFNPITQELLEDMDKLEFSYESIDFSELVIEAFGRRAELKRDKIRSIVESKISAIKSLLIKKAYEVFQNGMSQKVIDQIESFEFISERWVPKSSEDSFPSYLRIEDYFAFSNDVVGINVFGDFCSDEGYKNLGSECFEKRGVEMPKQLTSQDDYLQSKQTWNEIFSNDNNQLVVSLSEDYINKAMNAALQSGGFDELIAETEDFGILEFGPQTVQVRFNQKTGKRAKLYMDILFTPTNKKLVKFVTSVGKFHFPYELDLDIRVENIASTETNGEVLPHLVMSVVDVNYDDDQFLYGIPELGLDSNLHLAHKLTRKLVLNKIKAAVESVKPIDSLKDKDRKKIERSLDRGKKVNNKEMRQRELEGYEWRGREKVIALPQLEGLNLDRIQVENDGNGRLNLILNKKTYMDQ